MAIRLDDSTEEVAVELRASAGNKPAGKGGRGRSGQQSGAGGRGASVLPASTSGPPTEVTTGFAVECVWRGTSYERMQRALRLFAVDQTSVSGYLYHAILGHDPPQPVLQSSPAKKLSAPGLPDLNHSQVEAVQRVLTQPLSLIQGPPGTGEQLCM